MQLILKFLKAGSIKPVETVYTEGPNSINLDPWFDWKGDKVATTPQSEYSFFNWDRLKDNISDAYYSILGHLFSPITGINPKSLKYNELVKDKAKSQGYTHYIDALGNKLSSGYNPYATIGIVELADLIGGKLGGATILKGMPYGIKLPAGLYIFAGPNNKYMNIEWPGGLFEQITRTNPGWRKLATRVTMLNTPQFVGNTAKPKKITIKPIPKRYTDLPDKGAAIKALLKDIRTANIEAVNNFYNKHGINWADDDSAGILAGMPDDIKTPEWLTRYYENLNNIIIPLGEKLIKEGNLKKVGNIWKGVINGEFKTVDPRKYIISKTDNFIASGNKYVGGEAMRTGKNTQEALKYGYSEPFMKPLYTVVGNNAVSSAYLNHAYNPSTGQFTLVKLTKKNPARVSVPIINPIMLIFDPLKGGNAGSTNGVATGHKTLMEAVDALLPGHDAIKFKNIHDAIAPGSLAVDEIILNPSLIQGTVKSWWNNFDFAPGEGWFTYNNSGKLNKNNYA